MFQAACLVVLGAIFAFQFKQGLWTNAISLVNITLAGAIATNWFEPLSKKMVSSISRTAYTADMIVFWLLFGIALLLLRTFTGMMSRINVRFPKLVETIGGPLMALINGYIVLTIFAFSINLTPLQVEPFGGSFSGTNPKKNFFGVSSPDRVWIRLVRGMSQGAYSRGSVFQGGEITLPKHYQHRREKLKTQDGLFAK